MNNRLKPYWIRVLDHFVNNNHISNGLTIPFLLGCRSKVYPAEYLYTIKEFLCQLMISPYKVTLMTCPNIGHIVIGSMDLETKKIAEQGTYRNFGSIYITDDSFKHASSIDDIICDCERLYLKEIELEHYSFVNGRWSKYSETDNERFFEVSKPAIEAMMANRNSLSGDKSDEILRMHRDGRLPKVVPTWHLDITEIELENQPDNLPAARLYKGIEIIHDVDFEQLLNNMFPERAALYRERKLFHKKLDPKKIARIIDHWLNNQKLIPPTITFEARQDRNLFPSEGKHRLNVAYCCASKQIPIMILSSEKAKILPLLNK